MATRIRIGGLLRCCIETISDRGADGADDEVQPCRWCSSRVVFRSGAWEWYRDSRAETGKVVTDRDG